MASPDVIQDTSPERLELELTAAREIVPRVREAITEFAAPWGCDLQAVRAAATEAVSNAVVHAYAGRRPGPVDVRARVERHRLIVEVADRGAGVRPRAGAPGLGLGFGLMSTLATDVRIQSGDDGTIISMGFELPA